jgi:hypothetical protein
MVKSNIYHGKIEHIFISARRIQSARGESREREENLGCVRRIQSARGEYRVILIPARCYFLKICGAFSITVKTNALGINTEQISKLVLVFITIKHVICGISISWDV